MLTYKEIQWMVINEVKEELESLGFFKKDYSLDDYYNLAIDYQRMGEDDY